MNEYCIGDLKSRVYKALDTYIDVKPYLKRVFLYKLKSDVLKTPLCGRIKKYNKSQVNKFNDGIVDHDAESSYFDDLMLYGSVMLDQANKINYASYKRVERLKKRIIHYLSMGECTFLTLTFRDEKLQSTNNITRRKAVSRFLHSLCEYYVANIDFGVDDKYTKREHYHALCVGRITNKMCKKWHKHFGFTFNEKIRNNSKDDVRLSKYISKLTNHAIKESTKRQVYIYSKEKICKKKKIVSEVHPMKLHVYQL